MTMMITTNQNPRTIKFKHFWKKVAPVYKPFFNDDHMEQLFFGGSSSGKSYFLAQRCVIDVLHGRNYLIVRKTGNSIAESVFNEVIKKINELFPFKYRAMVWDINKSNRIITCKLNQAQIIFKGLDDVEKVKSITPKRGVITDIWAEEATEISYADWKQLDKRLRGKTQSNFKKRTTFSFNPILKNHWLYKEYFQGNWQDGATFYEKRTDDADFMILKTTYRDNTFLEEDDIKRLTKEKDPYYRSVYLDGNWGTLEDIVYNNWKIQDFDKESFGSYRFGIDWGFSCLVGDTQVITDKGNKPIKDIEIGDKVLTREGFKSVTLTQNKGVQEVYAVNFGKKNHIIVTGDHRIYTEKGWKKVNDLKEEETVCVKKSNLMEKFIIGIQKVNTQIIFIPTIIKSVQFCIEIFGNIITELFQRGILFTTLTIIHLITIFQILCAFLLVITPIFIFKKILALFQKKEQKKLEKFTDIPQQTGKKEEKNQSLLHKLGVEYAKNVEKNIKLLMCIKNIVVQNVENVPILETVKKNISAKYVELCSLLQHIIREQPVLTSVPIKRQLLTEKKEVYDITVENGEFFANGVLVHNCDPFAFIRLAVDLKKMQIWICNEVYQQELLNDKTIPIVREISNGAIVWCDSAEPKSIHEFVVNGVNARGVKKGVGSRAEGINFIKKFEIIVHPSCQNFINEIEQYHYKKDPRTGETIPDVVEKNDHLMDAMRYSLESDMLMSFGFHEIL